MRGATIDANAFRCHSTFRVLAEILRKLDEDEKIDDLIDEHFEAMTEAETTNQVCVKNKEIQMKVLDKINAKIDTSLPPMELVYDANDKQPKNKINFTTK